MKKWVLALIVLAAFAAVVMPASAIIQIWQMPGESFPGNDGRTSVQFYPGSNTQGYAWVIERYQPNGNFWGWAGPGPEIPSGDFPTPFSRIGNDNGPFTYSVFTTNYYENDNLAWSYGSGVDPEYFNYFYPPEAPVDYQLEDGMTTYIYINPTPDPFWYTDQTMYDYDLWTLGPDCWWPAVVA